MKPNAYRFVGQEVPPPASLSAAILSLYTHRTLHHVSYRHAVLFITYLMPLI